MVEKIKKIEIVHYNSDWPKIFEVESGKIKSALGNKLIDIHHIGSTSVPELDSKPKIDIIAVVKNLEESVKELCSIDFQYRGEINIPMCYFFSKRENIKFNLHVYESDHPGIELNILFRNYLRNNPKVRDDYAKVKYNILKDKTSFEKTDFHFMKYTLYKGDFVQKVLKKAGFNRIRILRCSSQNECDAARVYRQKHLKNSLNTCSFNDDNHMHLSLYEGVEIIGYAYIHCFTNDRGVIRIIVIDENKRNQGFGSQFLILIEKWLKNKNYKSIHVEAKPDTMKFYKKHSYINMKSDDPDNCEVSLKDVTVVKYL